MKTNITTEQYKAYLAYIREYNIIFSDEDLSFLESKTIDIDKSYLVLSKKYDNLKKFVNFYLTGTDEASFVSYMINEYMTWYCSTTNKIILNDVLIIHYPINMPDYTYKQQSFIENILLETITGRNRLGLVTLVISEKHIPYLEKCDEIDVIDYGDAAEYRVATNGSTENNNSKNTINDNISKLQDNSGTVW